MTVPFDRQIWTAQECADYLGLSYGKFVRVTQHRTDFPEVLANVHRWHTASVIAWKEAGPLPVVRKTSLYRHYDAEGTLLYVGVSLTMLHRIAKHRLNARWFGRITTIKVEHFDTRKEALDAESAAIKAEKPLHNVMLKRG